MQTICDNVIITYPTTPWMRLYTTLWNINQICIHNDNNKHFGKIEKTLQANMQWIRPYLYDTKLCGYNTV